MGENMKRHIFTVIALLFCGLLLAGSVDAAGEWTKLKDSNGIKSYERSVPGTDLKEYIAVTTIDAKIEVIGEALRDVSQYNRWIADCFSARIEKKYDRNTFVMYLVLDPPFIEKRDIILKDETVYDYDKGNSRISFFCTDEVTIPVEKKRTRVTVMNGMFKMEYLGRNKTKLIYKLKTDPAGDIPKKVAYVVIKNYPFDTLKKFKNIVTERKYVEAAKGSEEEREINTRAINENSVRKIFGENMMRVAKNKAVMGDIIASDSESIKDIAASGGAYANVEKAAKNVCFKYIDKIVTDKKAAESLKNKKKLLDEITDLTTTSSEANDATLDSIIARYNR
jgi:hypothetical protein